MYPITLQATNGTGTVTQSFSLTVAPAPVSGGTIPPVVVRHPRSPAPAPTSALAGGDRLAATPDGLGYWIVGANGSVTAYGTAVNYGSMSGHRPQPAHRRRGRHAGRQGLLAGGHRRRDLQLR